MFHRLKPVFCTISTRFSLPHQPQAKFSTSNPQSPITSTQLGLPSPLFNIIHVRADAKPVKVTIDPTQYGTRPHPDPLDLTQPLLGPLRSYKVFLKEGQQVLWCSCGHSKTSPFCDGTHKALQSPTQFKPILFEATESKLYGFCLCRYSHNPICDGTHKLFQGWVKPAVKAIQNNPEPPVFNASII